MAGRPLRSLGEVFLTGHQKVQKLRLLEHMNPVDRLLDLDRGRRKANNRSDPNTVRLRKIFSVWLTKECGIQPVMHGQ
jgi:hypothetical protein